MSSAHPRTAAFVFYACPMNNLSLFISIQFLTDFSVGIQDKDLVKEIKVVYLLSSVKKISIFRLILSIKLAYNARFWFSYQKHLSFKKSQVKRIVCNYISLN